MFTAATALSLVEDGTVDLFEPVSTYVPYANTNAPYEETLTLHQLMSHSAGYPTTFPGGSFASSNLDSFFENNAEQPLWSPPGAVYNYSNLGMSLAGLVLQEATGEKFADLVETRVFGPAGMDGASMHASEVEAEGHFAYGHSGSAASPTVTAPTDSYYPTEYYGPMGGAWGSVEDLARWAEVHLQGGQDVLSTSSMEALRTPQMATHQFPLQSYGYGLFIDPIYGYDLVHHIGIVGGYLTSWLMVPEADFSVVAVTNCDWYYPTNLTYRALDLFVGIPSLNLSPYLTSQKDWPQLVGTYLDPVSLGTINITQEGSSLMADFVDQGVTAELLGYYQQTYYLWYEPSGSWLYLTFWGAEEGKKAEYLVSLQGVATRTE
jgi:CubicO group peptidase (beta-lactamase class C family)